VEEPTPEQVDYPKEAVTLPLWEAHTGAGSPQELGPCEENLMLEQVCWQDL